MGGRGTNRGVEQYGRSGEGEEVRAPAGLSRRRGLGSAVMPDPFTGDRPHEWPEWVEMFEMYARVNALHGNEKADMMAVHLRGKARRIYVDLSEKVRVDYESLRSELTRKFSHGGTPALASVEFHTRVRKMNESYLDFAIELRRLARIVFPTLDDSAREQVCIGEFVSRMERKELRMTLRHRQFQTLDDVAFSMEWEGIELADMQERSVKQGRVDTRSAAPVSESEEIGQLRDEIERLKVQLGELKGRQNVPKPAQCGYCNKGGHDVRYCREWKRVEEGCWVCRQKGH